jgi:hypothetical protein
MRVPGIASALWTHRNVMFPTCALLLYILALVVSTHVPPTGLRPFYFALQFKLSDKLAHAVAYAGLTLLVMAVWRIRRPARMSLVHKGFGLVGVCAVIACWGLMDEFTQPYFGRQFDWFDWMANLTGMSLAVTASAMIPVNTRAWWLTAFSLR